MEKINKDNYEAWVLDYLEGNLGAEEKRDLFAFLDANPELKSMLDLDLSDAVLDPSNQVFAEKESLKVADESQLSLVTAEHWMIESVEGNLSASKQEELDGFVKHHNLEKTYTAYQMTKLQANMQEVYGSKEQLKVSTGIVIPMYVRWAAAAAVVILLVTVALNRGGVVGKPEANYVEFAKGGFEFVGENPDRPNLAEDVSTPELNQEESDFRPQPSKVIRTPKNLPEPNPQDGSLAVKNPGDEKDTLDFQTGFTPDSNMVNLSPEHDDPDSKEQDIPAQNDVASGATVVTEEPYKIVTDAASNFTNREVHFSRDRNTSTNEYVAYQFKMGSFEFERKKSK